MSTFERIDVEDRLGGQARDGARGTLPLRRRRGGRARGGGPSRRGGDHPARRRADPAGAPAARGRWARRRCSSCPRGSSTRGEDPLATAKRELAEEIGKGARSWTAVKSFYTSPGFTDEECHVYLADGPLRRGGRGGGERAHRGGRAAARASGRGDRANAGTRRPSSGCSGCGPTCSDHPVAGAGDGGRGAEPVAVATIEASPEVEALRAAGARLPRLSRVRARALAQHARGLPLRSPPVRALPDGAPACRRWTRRAPTWPTSSPRSARGARRRQARRRRPRSTARAPACAPSTATCAATGCRIGSHRRAERPAAQPQAAARAHARRGREAARPAARQRAGRAARPGAARADVRLRAARLRGDRARRDGRGPRGPRPAGARARARRSASCRSARRRSRAVRLLPGARPRGAREGARPSRTCS